MWSCQRSVLGGRLLKANKETKAGVKVDNADFFFSYLIMQQKCSTNFFKGNQIIKSFCT